MAVAVAQHSVVVLDDEDRVVEAVPSAHAGTGVHEAATPLEGLPSAGALFAPHFERARKSGAVVEFVEFVDGRVVRATAAPEGGRLVVSWHTLEILDVLTLEGLRESLERIMRTLERAEADLRKAQARHGLRLIDGGA